MRNRWGLKILVMLVASTGFLLTSCGPSQCNQACVTSFRTWVGAGAVGTLPADAAGFCVVNPSNSFCP